MPRPMGQNQYSRSLGRSRHSTPELLDVAGRRLAALNNAQTRSSPYDMANPALIYTDAFGLGRIDAILMVGGFRRVAVTRSTDWFAKPGAGISEFELRGALIGTRMDI